MTGNPISGHTNHNMTLSGTAQPVDGLTDGDHITSATLTNLLEGVHGNGIILEEDTAKGAGTRLQPENLPGICERTGANTFTVAGGTAILDGLVYTFAGGFGNSTTYTITAADTEGSNTALTSGQEAVVVVYLAADSSVNHVKMEVGSAITTGTNNYPVTPSAFLNNPSSTDNEQSIVLCVLRVIYDAGGGDLKVNISEVNDKRIFVRPTPIYFTPVVDGAVGATDAVASHTDLDAFHSGNAGGNFTASRLGGMWLGRGSQIGSTVAGDSTKDVLYFSGTHAARYSRSVFDRVLTSTASSIDLTSTDANVLVLNPTGGNFTITTSGPFPAGYIIEIKNTHGSNTGTFALTNSTTSAIDDTAGADGGYGRFVCTVSHATDPTFVRLL